MRTTHAAARLGRLALVLALAASVGCEGLDTFSPIEEVMAVRKSWELEMSLDDDTRSTLEQMIEDFGADYRIECGTYFYPSWAEERKTCAWVWEDPRSRVEMMETGEWSIACFRPGV